MTPGTAGSVADSERLATIVENMSDAFLAINREWRFTYFNDRALRSLGPRGERALGEPVFHVFPQFKGTDWERECRRAMEKRVPVTFDFSNPADKTWTEVRAYPTAEGIALYYRDITQRHRSELALQHQLAVTDGINTILTAALNAESEAALGRRCLDVAEEVSGSPFGFISKLTDDGLLEDIAVSNPGWDRCQRLIDGHVPIVPRGALIGLHGKVIREAKSFYTNEPAEHPDRVGLPRDHPPLTAFLGVPLRLGDEVSGLLGLGNRPGGYDDDTLELVERLAPAIVEAFTRLRNERRARRRAAFDRALADVERVAHSSLERSEILDRAVVEIANASGLNAIAVHLRSEDGMWEFEHSYGLPADLGALQLTDAQAPMSMNVIRSGRCVVMEDALTDPRANKPLVTRFNIRSLVGLPLVVRKQPFGVLFVGSIGEPGEIDDLLVDFLERVATTLSLALENARLYEGQHRIADTLQQALLALPDVVEGVLFAHAYHSASEATRVGGDFYDIFDMDRDRIGVVIGDLAGKGLDAAALTSLLKNVIRAHSASPTATPSAVLRATNDLVYRTTSAETFATVFLAFINCRDRSIVYTNAGHPAPLVIDNAGEVRLLPSNAPLLGALENAVFSDDTSVLRPNELILLYTDGVIEARSALGFYGEDRLVQLAQRTGDGEPTAIVREVVSDVLSFTDYRLSDDIAILAVKLTASTPLRSGQREIAV